MSEITEIPDVINTRRDPTLADQLVSMLGEALGHRDDPDAAIAHVLAALQSHAALPAAQRRIRDLELQALRIGPLEAELVTTQQRLSALYSLAGSQGDEAIGLIGAALSSHQHIVPELNALCMSQQKELADLRDARTDLEGKLKQAIHVLGPMQEALGGGASWEELERVTKEALAARASKQADEARMVEIERERAQERLDGMIAKAKREGRITPFVELQVRQEVAAGKLTLESADFMLSVSPRVPAFERRDDAPPSAHSPDAAALKWNGKTWDELQPRERAELKGEDPSLYSMMRPASLGREQR